MKIINRLLLFLLFSVCCMSTHAASKNGSDAKAKELFNKIYNSVLGPQGSTLSYKVNIIGLYKTDGTIVYKGKKMHYRESRFMSWQDGVTSYMVDKKKREVNIYSYDDERKDKYMNKFKYDVNNFDYSYTTKGNSYLITAKVRDASFFGIKWVTIKADRQTLAPQSITIKLSFFKTTVQISNFKSGNISDDCFIFPKNQFRGYQFTDHRKQ